MLQYRVRPSHVLGASLIGGTCCVASSDGEGARPIHDRTIAFGEIRSPGTIRNLRANPGIEVNFVDVFVRKGFRFAGAATVVERGQADFEILLPKLCSALAHRIRAIDRSDQGAAFKIASVRRRKGGTRAWASPFRTLQPRERFEQMTRPERPTLASTLR
jgi:uncharacterized protein